MSTLNVLAVTTVLQDVVIRVYLKSVGCSIVFGEVHVASRQRFPEVDRHFVAMLGRLAAALAVPAAGYSGMKLLQSVREPFVVLFLAAFS